MSSYQLQVHGAELHLTLSGDVTIGDATALCAGLREFQQPGACLVVDASAATKLDAAALQLLDAAARALAPARLSAGSTAWTDAFRRFGLTDPFTAAAPQPSA